MKTKKETENNYIGVPVEIASTPVSKLSQTSKLALGLIYTHSLITGDRKAKLTQKKLAMFLILRVRGVKDVIKSLTEKGYIEKSQKLGYVCKKEYKQHYRIDLKVFTDTNIRPTDKLLYGVISDYATRAERACFATNRTLAEAIGLKVRNGISSGGNRSRVSRGIKILENNHFISVDVRNEEDKEKVENGKMLYWQRRVSIPAVFQGFDYWELFKGVDGYEEMVSTAKEEKKKYNATMREVVKEREQNKVDGGDYSSFKGIEYEYGGR